MINQGNQETQIRKLFFSQKIKNIAYNIKYKAIGYLQQYNKETLLKENQRAYILGQVFQNTEDKKQQEKNNIKIYQFFNKIIWITYRSGFPDLPTEMDDSYITDTGWGCMIRVGQMMFAQILKKHSNSQAKQDIQKIIELFNDFDRSAIFSIQNIAKMARLQYGLKIGSWYNPSQISFILNELFEKKKLQQYQKLSFLIFNSGNMFFDQLIQKMTVKNKNCFCKIDQDQLICQKCHSTLSSLAIVVLVRIGLDKSQPKYLKVLNQLIQSKQFQGIIGGKPQKALYFVGLIGNQYIYLDPHYVQEAKKQIQPYADSYFCGSFRKCKNSSIDPSLGITFYLRDLKQLNEFYKYINFVKAQDQQNFFIFAAKETPSYAKQIAIKKNLVQDEDYFEEI